MTINVVLPAVADSAPIVVVTMEGPPGGVLDAFGRTGRVTAQAGDYTAAQVGADPAGAAANAQAAAIVAAATDATTKVTAEQARAVAVEAIKADLVGGVVPTSQIPALALTTAVTVASQAAMLALTSAQVQPGDIAVRTDGAGTFILAASDPSVLANWTLLSAPTDKVVSVNAQTGTVVLGPADVGAAAATDPRLSDARTPLGHHVTHELGGSDQLSLNAALVTSGVLAYAQLPVGSAANTVAAGNDNRLAVLAGSNTAVGILALRANTTGGGNCATGYNALGANTTGGGNCATGYNALGANTTGSSNCATGSASSRRHH